MKFHTFGDRNREPVILIHGMLTPWQIWEPAAAHFSEKYFVIIPELDDHTEDEPSRFISIENEAEKIRKYILKNFGGKVFAVCGLSIGGRIAAQLAASKDISTANLVLDGAPLLPLNGLFKAIMKKSYKSIIRRSKERDPKVIESFKRDFLPEKHLESYLKIAGNMDDSSVDNMIGSVFSRFEFPQYGQDCRILFMHGTKGNESVARKGALKLKEKNPEMKIKCFDGYAHAQLACFEEMKWIVETESFISGGRK